MPNVSDRWITARAIAAELGISLRRARFVISQPGCNEVKGHAPFHFRPAKVCRRSEVIAWTAEHRAELKAWASASRRAKLARSRALRRQARELRLLASVLGRMPDPAPEVCFWLSLLCQHPGFSQLKEAALRALTAAAAPSVLAYIESEDGAIAPAGRALTGRWS